MGLVPKIWGENGDNIVCARAYARTYIYNACQIFIFIEENINSPIPIFVAMVVDCGLLSLLYTANIVNTICLKHVSYI